MKTFEKVKQLKFESLKLFDEIHLDVSVNIIIW